MRLVGRVSRLEERSPAPSGALDLDFSLLNDDELRVIASLPLDRDGEVDLKAVSTETLDRLVAILEKLEGSDGAADR